VVFTWLMGAGIGPAAVGLPVTMAGDALAGAALRWFQRVRHTDDLSRLVRSATGNSVELSRPEFNDVRKLLQDPETWRSLGQGTEADLAARILPWLPARDSRTAADSQAAADTIAHGLLEFAVADLEPKLFQKLLLARLARLEKNQAEEFDEALLRMHADLVARLAAQGELDAERFAELLGHLKQVLERSPPGPADRGEIVIYLNTLIGWLSTDPWPHWFDQTSLTPAAIERRMRLTSPTDPGDELDADDLAGRCQRLVILGGPGSGKTWLAKRAARRCAEAALQAMATGLALDEVELPLYTTCSRLASAAGDIRQAAVSGALERIGDLGGSRITASLKEFFAERNAPTLLVFDSLDEAPDADDRLREADSLGPPWRIILTSRPGSWHHQLHIDTDNPGHRTGDIQPLRYPEDVEPFIQAWFAARPEWGADLAAQIARRPDLQQAATVPLILAFYCIVGGTQPLPEFRAQLYAKVLTRLLTSRWRGTGPQPDPGACLDTLRRWATCGATSDAVSGTGTWADDILTGPPRLSEADDAALDNLAPPLGPPDIDTGKVTRRFIHRSLREYLVAQYVATLSVDDAAADLLPHLWYDADWEVAAPAAIALHPQRDALLQALAGQAAGSAQAPADLAVIDGGGEFRILLARVARESGEADWLPAAARMIGQARVDLVRSGRVDALGRATAWATSAGQARDYLLGLLRAESRSWIAEPQLDGLVQLALTAEDQRQARRILFRLADQAASPNLAASLLDGILRLGPDVAERPRLRAAVLPLLAARTDTGVAARLAGQLASLGPTARERQQARVTLLRQAASVFQGWECGLLVDQVIRFAPTAAERRQASTLLLGLLARRTGSDLAGELLGTVPVHDWPGRQDGPSELTRLQPGELADTPDGAMVSGIVQLARTAGEKRSAYAMLLRLLPGEVTSPADLAVLNALARLARTAADQRFLRGVLLGLLPAELVSTAPMNVAACLALQLLELLPGPEDLRRPRATLLGLLDVALGAYNVGLLVAAVVPLARTRPGKQETRAALLRSLPRQDDISAVKALLNAVMQLDPTAADRRQARAALLGLLASETYGPSAVDLAQKLDALGPTATDRRQARAALLGLLASEASAGSAAGLASQLARMEPTPADQRRARAALLRAWSATTAYWELEALIGALADLDPADEDKRQVLAVLPDKLAAGTDGWDAADVARQSMRLNPAAADQRRIRAALLGLMARQTETHLAEALLGGLIELDPTVGGKRLIRTEMLRVLDSQADGWMAAWLMRRILQLDPAEGEQRRARAALLRLAATATDPRTVCDALIDAFSASGPTPDDKQRAREVLLARLARETDPGGTGYLLHALAQLDPTASDLSSWPGWAVAPSAYLLAAVRRNSAPTGWLALVRSLALPLP
jgi:hypothetical protein